MGEVKHVSNVVTVISFILRSYIEVNVNSFSHKVYAPTLWL